MTSPLIIAPIMEDEGKLLNVIESLGKLAWRRFQQRYPLAWVDNQFQKVDRSDIPPACSFRFAIEDPQIIDKLKKAVEAYQGKLEWVMVGRKREVLPGTNWVILAKRYRAMEDVAKKAGVTPEKYMGVHEPEFGPIAYEDIIGLTEHVRITLGVSKDIWPVS